MKSKKSKIIAVSLIAVMLLVMLIGALINKIPDKEETPAPEVITEEVEEPEVPSLRKRELNSSSR